MQDFIIETERPDDVDEVSRLLMRVWLDTYPNEAAGVSREWVADRRATMSSKEKNEERKEWLKDNPNNEQHAVYIAKDPTGKIVGFIGAHVDENGVQNLGGLYVDKDFHGHGVGAALMQKIIDWGDKTKSIELGVVSYNERAKAFYRKWGFKEIPDSETLFGGMMPEVKMIREAEHEV